MSTRSKYYRVKPQQIQNESKLDTDILMKISQSYGKYISRALTLFFGQDKSFVTIKAAERLIERALWVSEILRRKVPDLHQIINITEKKIVDIYMPREQGLLKVEKERFLTIIEITLTKNPTAEQKKAPGYQAPIKTDQKELLTKAKWEERQKERKDRRQQRGEKGQDKPSREEKGYRGDRGDRQNKNYRNNNNNRDRNQERGGQRRRGRN